MPELSGGAAGGERAAGVEIYDAMNQHLDKIFQGEDCLTAVIYCPPLLGVWLYYAFAPKEGFVAFL